jgi:hypothetical protein
MHNSNETEEFCLLESVKSQPTFQRNMSPPSSGTNRKPSKKPDCKPVARRALYLAYISTPKMEATCSSKTLVDFQRTAWSCIPEERILKFLKMSSVNVKKVIAV